MTDQLHEKSTPAKKGCMHQGVLSCFPWRLLLQEGEKFQIVDQAWRDLMEAVSANPAALAVGADKERLSSLQDCNQ
eukprot:1160559-Pelagomonas_calceolata.AAC.10